MNSKFFEDSRSPHILFVEDDNKISELLKLYLNKNGFNCSLASNAQEARELLETFRFDLSLVDVMLPGEDGVSLTRHIKANTETPVIILSAKSEVENRITGLEAGADDYVMKPFDPQEVVLRIKAVIRRTPYEKIKNVAFGRFEFDLFRGELTFDGDNILLSDAEKSILTILASRSNRTTSREVICRLASAKGEHIIDRTVDLRISRLRRKLLDDPQNPRFLKTVRGKGYVLVPDQVEIAS